ncbi:MAG: MFS transporter [Candidatus Poseidonia sp.]|nr:MFS transporter [Poseidonia sp.]MBL6747925.1 MFS transporter [Poseidonia sp.]MBL6893034.1 MFS transporter [Poseidonia sp.]
MNNLEGYLSSPSFVRPAHFLVLLVVFLPLTGCIGDANSDTDAVGTYLVESTWTTVELESKSAYYADDEPVSWNLDSSLVNQAIDDAGGNVVGIYFELAYSQEDETANGGLCTGGEDNVPDIIDATAAKADWTLSGSGENPGSHNVNLTWHNHSLLSGPIEGLTKAGIESQLAFGQTALGTYDLSVIVDARAFEGPFCSHTDEGEDVQTTVSLHVIDFSILGEDGEAISSLAVGDGAIGVGIFLPWFVGMVVFVGYVATRQRNRFHLDINFDEPEETAEGISSSDGDTLVDSYRARVITLSALYVAQGVPWGFITVTMVTFLAAEGADAGDLAYLLTLGTLPWSFKFLWGPVIDRFQIPELGRRRPWILIAQTGMIALLVAMLLIPNLTDNISLLGGLFFVYNVFTALQDVSTDALAVDVLQPHEFERVNSYMFTSKSLGGVIGGAGLGTIIGIVGIKGAFLIQIPILLVIMLVPLFMRERPGEKRFPWEDGEVVEDEDGPEEERDFRVILNNIKMAFSVRSAQLGIAVSLVISLAFILIPILPLLFLQELGWTQEEFNATKGGIILIVTMLGAMAGGELGRRFGGKSMLMFAALGASLVTLTWGMMDSMWSEGWFMMLVWVVHTFLWAIVSICAYSLMMRVTWAEVGGTQFTGYMAMMNLSAIIGYQLAPIVAARFDYQTIFYIAAFLETMVILATLTIDPEETDRTLGPGDGVDSLKLVPDAILE